MQKKLSDQNLKHIRMTNFYIYHNFKWGFSDGQQVNNIIQITFEKFKFILSKYFKIINKL